MGLRSVRWEEKNFFNLQYRKEDAEREGGGLTFAGLQVPTNPLSLNRMEEKNMMKC